MKNYSIDNNMKILIQTNNISNIKFYSPIMLYRLGNLSIT